MKKHVHFESKEPDQDFNRFDLPTVLGALFALFIIYIIIVGYSLIS